MNQTIRFAAIITIIAGVVAGTYCLDTNPAWAGLLYLGAVALWFALDADTPDTES
jgi:hypothetical protein